MKIQFDDGSYISYAKESDGTITIIIAAQDYENPLKKNINTVSLTEEEFKKLISS